MTQVCKSSTISLTSLLYNDKNMPELIIAGNKLGGVQF